MLCSVKSGWRVPTSGPNNCVAKSDLSRLAKALTLLFIRDDERAVSVSGKSIVEPMGSAELVALCAVMQMVRR